MTLETRSLFSLFAAYWAEYDAVSVAATIPNETDIGAQEITPASTCLALATFRLNELALQICAFVPRVRFEAYLKTQFLEALASENAGTLEADALAALLSSLSTLIETNPGTGKLVSQAF